VQRFLSQPFFVAENFTGQPGKYVKTEDTIRGFKEIIEGVHDELPEQAFLMVGTIEEAREKAERMAEAAGEKTVETEEAEAAEAAEAVVEVGAGVETAEAVAGE
jgi:hypothetical protein